jgi:hypothetical protein
MWITLITSTLLESVSRKQFRLSRFFMDDPERSDDVPDTDPKDGDRKFTSIPVFRTTSEYSVLCLVHCLAVDVIDRAIMTPLDWNVCQHFMCTFLPDTSLPLLDIRPVTSLWCEILIVDSLLAMVLTQFGLALNRMCDQDVCNAIMSILGDVSAHQTFGR